MMSWSPTTSRTAGLALVRLWFEPAWRTSPQGPQIRARLLEMLADEDDVQRLRAAETVLLLGEESPEPDLTLIRSRLEVEANPYVAAVLITRLSKLRFTYPEEVDSILAYVVGRGPWTSILAPSGSSEDNDTTRALVNLLLWLAFRRQTSAATQTVSSWSASPTVSEASRWSLHDIRDWLALPTEDEEVRRRAFFFAQTAASSLASQIDGETNQERISLAYHAADALVHAVYFAGGAYGDDGEMPVAPPAGFAEEALPLLKLLAAFRHPAIVHYMVQTASHLASVDPKAAFDVVHCAVRPDEPYAYDSLAAGATVALIERYLAEYRDLVVADQSLLTQIRTVLNAFAKAGWPSAVSLSYRLGAVFR